MSYKKRRWHNIRFVAFPSAWFWGQVPEFQDLSKPARMVYFCLKSAYVPCTRTNAGNNGRITFSYSALKKGTGYNSEGTISNALKELEHKGWIRRPDMTERSFLKGLTPYEITGRYDPCI